MNNKDGNFYVQGEMNQYGQLGISVNLIAGSFIAGSFFAETALEIHQLLKQLEQLYPTSNTTDLITIAIKAVEHIDNNPTLKQRTVACLKIYGLKKFEETINHPVAKILLAAMNKWRD